MGSLRFVGLACVAGLVIAASALGRPASASPPHSCANEAFAQFDGGYEFIDIQSQFSCATVRSVLSAPGPGALPLGAGGHDIAWSCRLGAATTPHYRPGTCRSLHGHRHERITYTFHRFAALHSK
jgi:hypothetical protein